MLSVYMRQVNSWSRRCSTETVCSNGTVCSNETVFSIQGRETDYVRDTTDTEARFSGSDVEYEPVTDQEEEEGPVDGDTSEESDDNIIRTRVVAVPVDNDDQHFADSEVSDSHESDSKECDSEIDLYDFWLCIKCRNKNTNPMYSYCQKCFKTRKSFFPARPNRKKKRKKKTKLEEIPPPSSQDSGVHSAASQELDTGLDDFPDLDLQGLPDLDFNIHEVKELPVLQSQDLPELDDFGARDLPALGPEGLQDLRKIGEGSSSNFDPISNGTRRKRRGTVIHFGPKRMRLSQTGSDTDIDDEPKTVSPLVKSISDPAVTIEVNEVKITKKVVANTLKQNLEGDLCVVCAEEPKSGVFVHGRIAHICCCYKCAVKVWAKARRCPVCNCRVSNVLKAVIM